MIPWQAAVSIATYLHVGVDDMRYICMHDVVSLPHSHTCSFMYPVLGGRHNRMITGKAGDSYS